MKNLDLEALGVVELSQEQAREVEGGIGIFAAVIAAFVGYVVGIIVEASR